MKKTITLFSIVIMTLFLAAAAQAFTLTDTDGYTYSASPLTSYQGNQVFALTVDGSSHGLLFYDARYSALKITVFEDNSLWGWSLEGHWDGSSAHCYGVNNNGRTYETDVTMSSGGRAAIGGDGSNDK